MIQAGELNRRVDLVHKSSTRDEAGSLVDEWMPFRSCWAKIESQISGKTDQNFTSGEFVSRVIVLITFRWARGLRMTPAERIVYVDPSSGVTHNYEVSAVTNLHQRNEAIVCLCYEIEAQE